MEGTKIKTKNGNLKKEGDGFLARAFEFIKNIKISKMINLFKPKKVENGRNRKIDQSVQKTTQSLSSQFSLISHREIATWKGCLIIFFVGGFFTALIWSAYNSWYVGTSADSPPVIMSVVTDTDARKTGDQYVDHIYLDTGTKAVVAVQAIAAYDKDKVQIVSIDDATSDFPNEIKKDDDGDGKIFVALAKPTPGVNSVKANVVNVTVKALADFTGSALTLKFDSPAAVDDSAAIEDDGNGTNILTRVKNEVTTPTPPPPSDTTPPVISGGTPTGSLAAGTTTATLRVLTNENSTCKYDTSAGEAYNAMAHSFDATGAKSHTSSLTGLKDDTAYNYYVRCKDGAGNADANDYTISFSVSKASASGSGPVITKSAPSGVLSAGTAAATLKVATNVRATCKYSTTAGTDYDSMKDTFSTTDSKTSSTKFGGLENGTSYNVYVRCKDADGNVDASDHTISFSVAAGEAQVEDNTAPNMSDPSPSGELSSGTTSTTISVKTDKAATCKYGTSSLPFSRLKDTFSTTGGTSHSSSINVESGKSYKYYVRCQNSSGIETSGYLTIGFSVQ